MESLFVCPACRVEHAEPAEAALGHWVLCLGCAIGASLAVHEVIGNLQAAA